MVVESGSPNASRIPGIYAYPIHRYSNQAISPISGVNPSNTKTVSIQANALKTQQIQKNLHTQKVFAQHEDTKTFYEGRVFQNNSSTKGLIFDITV